MYRAEFYKLNKSNGFRLSILLTLLVTFLFALFRPCESYEEALKLCGKVSSFLIIFLATRVALSDHSQGTMKNMVASGMKRSSIYYSKLKTVMTAAIILYIVDCVVRLLVSLLYHKFPMTTGIPVTIGNIFYRLILCILCGMLYFAIAWFIGNSVWALMISLAYYLGAASSLSYISSRFSMPVDLSAFCLNGIRGFLVGPGMPTDQIAGIAGTLIFVLLVVFLVQILSSGREIQ